MDASRSSTGPPRRHGRNISHPVPTPATAGPLDATDSNPLSDHATTTVAKASPDMTASVQDQEATPPRSSVDAPPRPTSSPVINLRFLQVAKIYHVLGTDDVPEAFLNSENQPSIDATLPDLIQRGHFRRAAEAARRAIIQSPPDAADQIFPLLYTRLACLVLVSRTDFAAEEAVPLTELLARSPAGTHDLLPLIPWELRVLLVRLQSIGLQDGGRRAVMSLYALAAEVRANLRQADSNHDQAAVRKWNDRLQDIGLRVSDTLVEMGELETAYRHLDTLTTADPEELTYRKALLRVRVGDVAGAQQLIETLQVPTRKRGLEALVQTASDLDVPAIESWQDLIEEFPGHEVFAQNAAIAMLYAGRIASARDLLEELSRTVPMFPALLFNLSTVYELCTERAVERKATLVQLAAQKTASPASGGWERANFDFKL